MRIYIIGNDGITLCREAPATVNDGEVAVASKEELHAAPLSGKRLLPVTHTDALFANQSQSILYDLVVFFKRAWNCSDPEPSDLRYEWGRHIAKRASGNFRYLGNSAKIYSLGVLPAVTQNRRYGVGRDERLGPRPPSCTVARQKGRSRLINLGRSSSVISIFKRLCACAAAPQSQKSIWRTCIGKV